MHTKNEVMVVSVLHSKEQEKEEEVNLIEQYSFRKASVLLI